MHKRLNLVDAVVVVQNPFKCCSAIVGLCILTWKDVQGVEQLLINVSDLKVECKVCGLVSVFVFRLNIAAGFLYEVNNAWDMA